MSQTTPSLEKQSTLARRMAALGLREEDLSESFVRSSGHGGQNVNKVATCAVLVHQPTGLQVRCQATRHQAMNRFLARQLLCDKLEAQQRARAAEIQARRARIRRQKRKRSRASKERMLADKAHRSRLKSSRRRPASD
ncbi:MAG: peptide chain release factor-like protein [Verrucomicrobiales bacterium]|nr:peptide chain release factor-like protein [Verrucomicrobiales bacterium]